MGDRQTVCQSVRQSEEFNWTGSLVTAGSTSLRRQDENRNQFYGRVFHGAAFSFYGEMR